ncbi:hypothetical protein EVAR_50891_1 [Eumeta japonica]|uniref:Uncharacterized protein n=1 Tax=Eumeta variegata TaxID=151549 RepID=A0A4C1YD71_EUMVA|nr:hypothetical protein EVAR_50891_1 [Eumeta japonica]
MVFHYNSAPRVGDGHAFSGRQANGLRSAAKCRITYLRFYTPRRLVLRPPRHPPSHGFSRDTQRLRFNTDSAFGVG